MKSREVSRRQLLRQAAVSGLVIAAAPAVVACGSSAPATSAGNISGFRAKLAYADYAPFSFKQQDVYTGLSVALINEIFGSLKIQTESVTTGDWSGLIPGLLAGRYNLIGTGLVMQSARCAQVAFTDPFVASKEIFAFRKGESRGLKTLDDVKNASGVRLGVIAGSAEIPLVKQGGIPDAQTALLPDTASAFSALGARRVDVLMMDNVGAPYYIINSKSEDQFEVSEPFAVLVDGKPQISYSAMAFPKSETAVLEAFNSELKKILENGRAVELTKNFGGTAAMFDDARQHTAGEVCGTP
ncbi:transporter substrate-binding domain-containing protein [Amycolatopsis thermoflava]|uniref:transporter substrate-binding domain-containing protein n=1 Tax=Amycolatopsis thermoflava TaxID=84480 RepID=UPI003EB92143